MADEQRTSWPLIVGITAGVLGALAAVVIIYSVQREEEPQAQLRDATQVIEQCRDQIKEIEASLELLKESA